MTKYKIENLVVLEYASNTCWTKVRDAKEVQEEMQSLREKKSKEDRGYYEFSIDLDKGTWCWWKYKGIKIGESRYTGGHGERIIGVYDRTNTSHLSSLAHESINATTDWSNAD